MKGSWRASRRRYRSIIWDRLLFRNPPARCEKAEVFYAIGIGELRVAAKFLQIIDDKGGSGIVLCETDDYQKVRYRNVPVYSAPFNNPFSVLIALKRLRPKTIWVVENLHNHHLKAVAAMLGIPTIVFNVQDSVRREVRTRGASWRIPLVGLYATQSPEQVRVLADRLVHSEFVFSSGPIALGVPELDHGLKPGKSDLRSLQSTSRRPRIVAGSTHPSDEIHVLRAFAMILETWPLAELILAPRQVDRVVEVESRIAAHGLSYRLYSGDPKEECSKVTVLDTLGDLQQVYRGADIAFVGGTFDENIGGHTPMEAFSWGIPITSGPHYAHHRESMELLRSKGVLAVTTSAQGLYDIWRNLLVDSNHAAISDNAKTLQKELDERTLGFFDEVHRRYDLQSGLSRQSVPS